MLRVAVIIPDRGDRPELMKQCLRLLARQTLQPYIYAIDNDPPANDKPDITTRYRRQYERLNTIYPNSIDVIAFIENDDYYAPDYLESMCAEWEKQGRPNMLGCSFTVYYHLRLRAWFTMHHSTRSSAMNMLIKPGLTINWPLDHDPYTDAHLWNTVKGGVVFTPQPAKCLGLKHGTGKCGGRNHTDKLHRFINPDPQMEWLAKHVDAESLEFYKGFKQWGKITDVKE